MTLKMHNKVQTVEDVLITVDAILATEDQWTKNAEARDILGHDVDYNNSDAVCYCLVGALKLAVFPGGNFVPTASLYPDAYNRLFQSTKFTWVSRFNDAPSRTFAEVKNLIHKAIGA